MPHARGGERNEHMRNTAFSGLLALTLFAALPVDALGQAARPAGAAAPTNAVQRIEARGGYVVRDRDGNVTEVSLERTWATDNDIDFVVELKTVKKLDLSFTYITDKGIKKIGRAHV